MLWFPDPKLVLFKMKAIGIFTSIWVKGGLSVETRRNWVFKDRDPLMG